MNVSLNIFIEVADMRGLEVKYGGNYEDVLYGQPLSKIFGHISTYLKELIVFFQYNEVKSAKSLISK